MNDLEGRSVLIVGLGTSGFATARALAAKGARVRVTEASETEAIEDRAQRLRAAGIVVETGGHDLGALDADLAVVSPGIPPASPIVRALREAGIEIVGELEVAARLAGCDFIAVTGTNGKTTTTMLVAAILAEAGIPSIAAGNIGLPLIDAVSMVPPDGVIALEVSSFQLELIDRFRPKIAVLLNLAEDHIDWHGTYDAYVAAKARIVENQMPEDVFVVNHEDTDAMKVTANARSRVVPFSARRVPPEGIGVSDGSVVWRGTTAFAVDDVPALGIPGLEDAIAAAGATLEYGIEPGVVARALKAFRPPMHRLEVVAKIDGITYVDDSKATNPHATLAAVRGLNAVVLIAGGRGKGIDLSPLAATVPPVYAVVALGEAAPEIERIFAGRAHVERVATMADAVRRAGDLARPGGYVLLSPACASLDMYPNYAARGEDFATQVRSSLLTTEGEAHGRAE